MKDKGEFGLVADGKIKQYVKDWYSLLDEFELSNSYIMENLKRKLDDYSKVDTKDIVDDLKKKSD